MSIDIFSGSFNTPVDKKTKQPKKDGKPIVPDKGYFNLD